jgi:hypothetical protein
MKEEQHRHESNEHQHVVCADWVHVSLTKRVDDTLKLHSVSGSRIVRQKPQAGETPTQEWKLRVACMHTMCLSLVPHDQRPFTGIRNDRKRHGLENAKRNSVRILQKTRL